jgi:hypothetical protein
MTFSKKREFAHLVCDGCNIRGRDDTFGQFESRRRTVLGKGKSTRHCHLGIESMNTANTLPKSAGSNNPGKQGAIRQEREFIGLINRYKIKRKSSFAANGNASQPAPLARAAESSVGRQICSPTTYMCLHTLRRELTSHRFTSNRSRGKHGRRQYLVQKGESIPVGDNSVSELLPTPII